jgi:hypothetical protein
MLEQDESATDLFYRPGASKIPGQKFELVDSQPQEHHMVLHCRVEQLEEIGSPGVSSNSEPPTNNSDGWLAAGQTVAALPLDKQAQVILSGLSAGLEQYRLDEREREWGAIIGSVQGVGNVAVNLAKIADFSAYCITGDKVRAAQMVEEFGTALGQTVVSGVRLFEATQKYSYDVGYSGDYAKPLRDFLAVGKLLNNEWSQLPPREQERRKYEIMSQMVADGLVGTAGAQAIGKAKTLTEVLDNVAEQAARASGHGIDAVKGTAGKILNAVDDLIQPEFITPDGQNMRLSREELAIFRKGDKGLPEGVTPSEKLVTTRRRGLNGEAIHSLTVSEEVYKAAEARGLDRAVVKEKFDKLSTCLTQVYTRIGDYDPRLHGTERAYGSAFHELLRQKLGSDELMHTEASFRKGEVVSWGRLGSSRVDIALGEKEKPFASLCLKTLQAVPSAQQERGWINNLPRLDDNSTVPRIYFKLGN